ncbi:MAG: GNAT family N-acetyltransferase [Oscillospiraceae bacterium]|nr:GNAT family N-acetyltransferase [Oscillospiraceae bacterium]
MKELETERLLLRKVRREDAQRIFDCWASDPEVTRYLTWQPHASVAMTKAVMDRWLADYDKPDTYRYGIELRETGELIGMIDVVGYHHGNPVIGYCSGRAYWGNGYMTEALKALCAALFEAGYSMIRIEAVRENIGSNRVIQKAGFRFANSREQPMSESKPEIVTINSYYLPRE